MESFLDLTVNKILMQVCYVNVFHEPSLKKTQPQKQLFVFRKEGIFRIKNCFLQRLRSTFRISGIKCLTLESN